MKKKHLNTLKIASLTLMLGCFAVGGLYNHYQEEQQDNVVKVERKVQPKYASYDDEQYTITLTPNELNNYIFSNLATLLNENYELNNNYLQGSDINYNFITFNFVSEATYSYVDDSIEDYISFFFLDDTEEYDYEFVYNDANLGVDKPFEYSIEWELTEDNYEHIKTAIELDIQANQPVSMGDSIVGAITSGLGMIPDLASEFLTGFTTLFWNSTTETLTTFGLFSLVFLGIAITMAVIKLVLAIIRGSTGA